MLALIADYHCYKDSSDNNYYYTAPNFPVEARCTDSGQPTSEPKTAFDSGVSVFLSLLLAFGVRSALHWELVGRQRGVRALSLTVAIRGCKKLAPAVVATV